MEYTGYWLVYPTLVDGAGTRYRRGQIVEIRRGDADKRPYLGDAEAGGQKVFNCLWIRKKGVEDSLGRCLILDKYDFIRSTDSVVVDKDDVKVDMTKREHVYLGLGDEGRWRFWEDSVELIKKKDS